MLLKSFSTSQSSRRAGFPPFQSDRGPAPLPQSPQGSRDGGDTDALSLFKQLHLCLTLHKFFRLNKLPWSMSARYPVPVCEVTVGRTETSQCFYRWGRRKGQLRGQLRAWGEYLGPENSPCPAACCTARLMTCTLLGSALRAKIPTCFMGPTSQCSKVPICKNGSRRTGSLYLWVTATGLDPRSPDSQARALSGHSASLREARGTGAASMVGRFPLPSTVGKLPQRRGADG